MKSKPLVSVMMAAFNAEDYIHEAISSVLNQTYTNWELIVLNDGSTDATKKIICGFSDARIRYYENPKNKGLVYTRNRMIDLCKGDYLAVLDSDDISYPNRLQKEVEFLEKHKDFGLVGGGIEMIDASGKLTGARWTFSEKPAKIPTILIFNNYFAHSTVMIRKAALPTPAYRDQYPPAEDYDLWIRISQNWKVYNFKDILAKYRIHATNTSFSNKSVHEAAERRIFFENLDRTLSTPLPESQRELLYLLVYGRLKGPVSSEEFRQVRAALNSAWRNFKLSDGIRRRHFFAMELYRHYLSLLILHGIPHWLKIGYIFRMEIGSIFTKLALILWIAKKKIRSAYRT